MAPPAPRGSGVMAPVPQVVKQSTEDPGRSSGSGILRPVPEEPERVERPAPPEGGEDEEIDFPGIEKLFQPYEHKEAAGNLRLHHLRHRRLQHQPGVKH